MCVYQQWRFLQLQKQPRPSRTDETKNALVQSFSCSSFHLSLRQRCRKCHTDQSGPPNIPHNEPGGLVLLHLDTCASWSAMHRCRLLQSSRWWRTQAVMVTGPSAHVGVMKLILQKPYIPIEYIWIPWSCHHISIWCHTPTKHGITHKMGSHMWLAAHPVEMLYTWSRVKSSCALDSRHL